MCNTNNYQNLYNTNNLKVISKNILKYKSNIYTKQKIKCMIIKKESLIHLYKTISNRLYKYKIYLEEHFHQPNISIKNRVRQLNKELVRVTNLLDFIEKEELMIMKVFKISPYPIVNCINNLKSIFKIS